MPLVTPALRSFSFSFTRVSVLWETTAAERPLLPLIHAAVLQWWSKEAGCPPCLPCVTGAVCQYQLRPVPAASSGPLEVTLWLRLCEGPQAVQQGRLYVMVPRWVCFKQMQELHPETSSRMRGGL